MYVRIGLEQTHPDSSTRRPWCLSPQQRRMRVLHVYAEIVKLYVYF